MSRNLITGGAGLLGVNWLANSWLTEKRWSSSSAGRRCREFRRTLPDESSSLAAMLVSGFTSSKRCNHTGRIASTAFEGPEEFQTLRDGRVERVELRDDLSLFIHFPDVGLIVLTGCAHAGIVNTIQHGLSRTGATRLHAVIGGFYLVRASIDRIRRTVEALQTLQPEVLAPLHCTGDRATVELSQAFGDRLHFAHVGSVFEFPSMPPVAS
jgi:metal-dependent hydrolase (beta-lactamase superfamily II)